MRTLSLGWVWVCAIGCATSPAPTPPAPAPASTEATSPRASAAQSEAAPPSPAPAAPVVEGYSPEIAAVLAAPHIGWDTGSTRIAIARRGAVRLRPDGPDLGLRDQAPLAKRMQVVEDAERPRVATDDRDIRLLLHVDRQDARPVVLRAAPLRPDPKTTLGDPPRRGHVILQPGAWVDVNASEGALTQVAYDKGDEPKLTGWIDAAALGTTVTMPAPGDGAADDLRPAYVTRRPTKLVTRPGSGGGKALVELDASMTVHALAAPLEKGHRLVEHRPPCEDDLVYVGFVRARDLEIPSSGGLYGCGRGGGRLPRLFGEAEAAPRVILAAGRFLLDADVPTVVGCVLEPTEVADLGDGRYAVATMWGPIPVRLAPEGFEGTCGK